MAVGYATLFTRIGRLVAYVNAYLSLQTSLMGPNTGADDILDEYADSRDLVNGVQTDYTGFVQNVHTWISSLIGYCDATLLALSDELRVDASVDSVLDALVDDMIANTESVSANVISSSVGAIAGSGNGSLLVDIYEPVNIGNDQRLINETVKVRCTLDSYSGSSEGSEQFEVRGLTDRDPKDGVNPRGSGSFTGLSVSVQSTLVTNGDFESFTVANTPDSWVLDSGTVAVNIFSSSSPYRGASALKLTADGVAAAIAISQNILSLLKPDTRYCLTVRLKNVGVFVAGSSFVVKATINASDHPAFSANPSTLTTSYVLHDVFFTTPPNPSSASLTVSWTSANLENAVDVIVDDVILSEVSKFSRMNMAVVPGDVPFTVGDEWTVTNTNNYAGVFQTFFGRFYSVVLPSSGTPTRLDSLAS